MTTAWRDAPGLERECPGQDIIRLNTVHHVAATRKDAVRMAVMAGVDMSMVPQDLSFYDDLLALVREGAVPESRIDESVRRILTLKGELGLFDNTGGCGDCRGVVTINSATGAVTRNVEYFALAHASKFVRPGAHRIASTEPGGLATVAFKNSDDGSKALIVLNTGAESRPFTVRWAGTSMAYTLPSGAVATFTWN